MEKFVEKSSIHGIQFIFSSKSLRVSKIFWLLAFTASICGFSFYIYLAFMKLNYYPEIIKSTRDLSAKYFPYPAVTICSSLFAKNNSANWLRTITQSWESKTLNLTEEECFTFIANIHWCHPVEMLLVQDFCKAYNINDIDVIREIDKSSLGIEEFLGTEEFHDKKITKVLTDFGICYSQYLMSLNMIYSDEIDEDLKFVSAEHENETEPIWTPEKGFVKNSSQSLRTLGRSSNTRPYNPILDEIDKENICETKNFFLFIHKPNEIITPYHDAIYINYEETVKLKFKVKSLRTDPALRGFNIDVRKCYFEGEKNLKFFKTYTKSLCEWECQANTTLKECGCVKFSMPRDKVTRVCNASMADCPALIGIKKQSCSCYAPCNDIEYSYKIDRAQLNRMFFMSDKPKTSTGSYIEVTCDDEFVEEIENLLSYKIQNFIADFGGLLGLFLGCSLLSIIEIFYFFGSFFISFCFKKKPSREASTNKIVEDLEAQIKNLEIKVLMLENECERKMLPDDQRTESSNSMKEELVLVEDL